MVRRPTPRDPRYHVRTRCERSASYDLWLRAHGDWVWPHVDLKPCATLFDARFPILKEV
jgi:hypothetical protein